MNELLGLSPGVGASAFTILLGVAAVTSHARAHAELEPFVLPWDDASPTITDLSGWNDAPAGKFGRVRAGADGHLYADNQRIRFFGVDVAFDGNIPSKQSAPGVAGRLAKFGVNIVRFHIMDMSRFPRGILSAEAEDSGTLDPEAMDRLDFFISQLKAVGIYANLNTLTYRYINRHDGLPAEIEEIPRAQDRNIIDFFFPAALDIQKDYARKLLTHRNSYTGMTYAGDPAIAFVEIHNENGLIHAYLDRGLEKLPSVFLDELARQWNTWLLERYGSRQALDAAWGREAEELGDEILLGGDLSAGLSPWWLETPHNAQATVEVIGAEEEAPASGHVRIVVAKPPESGWPIRFQQPGLAVEDGRSVTASFWARADVPATIQVGIEEAHTPWHRLGFPARVSLTDRWQQFGLVFTANATDANARLIFDERRSSGVLELAGISLRRGGVVGLGDGEDPAQASIPALLPSDLGARTLAAQRDWMRFLWETEDTYWREMRRYIKQDLGVGALVIGTAIGCAPPNMMAAMDATDAHAYWTHPVFPNRAWDGEDWYVQNRAMVNSAGGNLADIAVRRVLGKPHCITEYGHAAPNTHGAEANLLLAAYAALQDWDYLSLSRYSHRDDWDIRRIWNYFDIDQSPVRMATLLPAMALFRRGDVRTAEALVVAPLDREAEIEGLRAAQPWSLVTAGTADLDKKAALLHRLAMATEGQRAPDGARAPDAVDTSVSRFVSDTGELAWDVSEEGRGVVTIDTARSKAVVGYGAGKAFDLGGVVIEPGDTRQDGFSAIAVTAIEGEMSSADCRLLITAGGHFQNSGWGWEELGDSRVTLRRDWGSAPTLIEIVPGRITLPQPARGLRAWAVDERGQRGQELELQDDVDGRAVLTIGPPQATLWYEVSGR